jgi:hypothetical protein
MGKRVNWSRVHQRAKRSSVAAVRAAEVERAARQPKKLTKAEMRAMIEAALRKREPSPK